MDNQCNMSLDVLSNDVLRIIFAFLDPPKQASLRRTCKKWRNLIDQNYAAWKPLSSPLILLKSIKFPKGSSPDDQFPCYTFYNDKLCLRMKSWALAVYSLSQFEEDGAVTELWRCESKHRWRMVAEGQYAMIQQDQSILVLNLETMKTTMIDLKPDYSVYAPTILSNGTLQFFCVYRDGSARLSCSIAPTHTELQVLTGLKISVPSDLRPPPNLYIRENQVMGWSNNFIGIAFFDATTGAEAARLPSASFLDHSRDWVFYQQGEDSNNASAIALIDGQPATRPLKIFGLLANNKRVFAVRMPFGPNKPLELHVKCESGGTNQFHVINDQFALLVDTHRGVSVVSLITGRVYNDTCLAYDPAPYVAAVRVGRLGNVVVHKNGIDIWAFAGAGQQRPARFKSRHHWTTMTVYVDRIHEFSISLLETEKVSRLKEITFRVFNFDTNQLPHVVIRDYNSCTGTPLAVIPDDTPLSEISTRQFVIWGSMQQQQQQQQQPVSVELLFFSLLWYKEGRWIRDFSSYAPTISIAELRTLVSTQTSIPEERLLLVYSINPPNGTPIDAQNKSTLQDLHVTNGGFLLAEDCTPEAVQRHEPTYMLTELHRLGAEVVLHFNKPPCRPLTERVLADSRLTFKALRAAFAQCVGIHENELRIWALSGSSTSNSAGELCWTQSQATLVNRTEDARPLRDMHHFGGRESIMRFYLERNLVDGVRVEFYLESKIEQFVGEVVVGQSATVATLQPLARQLLLERRIPGVIVNAATQIALHANGYTLVESRLVSSLNRPKFSSVCIWLAVRNIPPVALPPKLVNDAATESSDEEEEEEEEEEGSEESDEEASEEGKEGEDSDSE